MTQKHQNQTKTSRRLLFLGFPNVLLLDITGPAQVFGSANTILGEKAYEIDIVTADGHDPVSDTGLTIGAKFNFENIGHVDDFIVPGGPGLDLLLNDIPTLRFIKNISKQAERVISICSGSLLVAATGALDGKHATSHWERSEEILKLFPNVAWDVDKIYTQDGKYYCSAGVTAGIDLCLALLEEDHGRTFALDVAREMVVFLRRYGGQSQYSKPLQAQSSSPLKLAHLYEQITENPAADWNVSKMAAIANMTERSLHRHFTRDLKILPSHFIEDNRVALARKYLEQSGKSLKEIAKLAGFKHEQSMRRSFQKRLNILPSDYRDRFGNAKTDEPRAIR